MAEGTRLLSEYGGQTPSRVRIPPSPSHRNWLCRASFCSARQFALGRLSRARLALWQQYGSTSASLRSEPAIPTHLHSAGLQARAAAQRPQAAAPSRTATMRRVHRYKNTPARLCPICRSGAPTRWLRSPARRNPCSSSARRGRARASPAPSGGSASAVAAATHTRNPSGFAHPAGAPSAIRRRASLRWPGQARSGEPG